MEKEVTGTLSFRPSDGAVFGSLRFAERGAYRRFGGCKGRESSLHDGDTVTVLAILTKVRLKVTKSNNTMAFVTVEDVFGSMEMLVFPKTLSEYAEQIAEGKILRIRARLSLREDEDAKLICRAVSPAPSVAAKSRKPKKHSGSPPGLYLKVPDEKDEKYQRAKKYLAVFDGGSPVVRLFCRFTPPVSCAAFHACQPE